MLSYSYMAVLVPIFLLTDYLRYKPVLVLQGLSYVSVWLLLLLGTSVLHMQLLEFFYSITMASRIAYSSYIFSLVRPARYQRMAGYSRAAVLLGVFSSSVLGQLLVSAGGLSFTALNRISLGFLLFSLGLALFLKRPKRSLFFNRSEPAPRGASPSEADRMRPGAAAPARGKRAWRAWRNWRAWVLVRMLRELGTNLRVPQLRLWTVWWVFNSTGYYLITYYVHILWTVVHPVTSSSAVYNGGADATSTLLSRPVAPPLPCPWPRPLSWPRPARGPARPLQPCAGEDAPVTGPVSPGAIAAFAAGFVDIRWALWAKLVIAVVTAAQAGLVFLLYSTRNIWLCYLAFVLFRSFYQFLVPIAT